MSRAKDGDAPKPKARSLLVQAGEEAEARGEKLEPLWFKVPEKLLAAVLMHAKASPRFADAFIHAAADFAGTTKGGSGLMRKRLSASRTGAIRGREAIPGWRDEMLLTTYEMGLNRFGNRREAMRVLADIMHTPKGVYLSESTLNNRLTNARKRRRESE